MSGRLSFFGIVLASIGFSWLGLVYWPGEQAASLVPGHPELHDGKIVTVTEGDAAPVRAAAVYFRKGCYGCHTRQVGPADITYGWGTRRTLPGEWARLGVPPEGTGGSVGFSRIGPDLTHLSSRRTEVGLAAFLWTHGGGADSMALAEWLLQTEPKDSKDPKEAKGKKP